jgi:uridylate cyclase
MALADDLRNEVTEIFKKQWEERKGQVVPQPKDLKLGNDAVQLERATILYADLHGSTDMVNKKKWWFAAEVYKTFLLCAARLVRAEDGTISAYDGDRIMGVFIGQQQSNTATRCGLKVNYAVKKIVQPALNERYGEGTYTIRHCVGIDTSQIYVARTGVRGDNDLVFVGRAANYAAKLTELDHGHSTWITKEVYDFLNEKQKKGGKDNELMWKEWTWSQMNNIKIYSSNWTWAV